MGKSHRKDQREHFTKIVRTMTETPAWKALSANAVRLYITLKFEWKGPANNNNGSIKLSVRDAARKMGVGVNTAARAFHDLQAKGFIFCTQQSALGVDGQATQPTFEITEIAMPNAETNTGRRLFLKWEKGRDFPVKRGATLSRKKLEPCRQNVDEA